MAGNFFKSLQKENVQAKVYLIKISDIYPNPNQPRKHFDTLELSKLAQSIKECGVLQPLTVKRIGDKFELISGERRLRASKLAGLETVPCIITDVSDNYSAILALTENIQREDLSFFEEADAINKLIVFYGMTQEKAASMLGVAQSTIANKLRLLKLSSEERDIILKASLTERHARALLKADSPEMRKTVLDRVIRNSLNVERTENLIEALLKEKEDKEKAKKTAGAFKNVRLFVNTINKAVDTMRLAGVDIKTEKTKTKGYIEYFIKIPTND